MRQITGIRLQGEKELIGILGLLGAHAKDYTQLANRVKSIISRSIMRNFDEGGRPEKWPKRWDALESIFPNLKKKGNPLMVSGDLRTAVINPRDKNGAVRITRDSIEYSTNFEYAALQNDGGPSQIKVPKKYIKHVKSDGGKHPKGTAYVILKGSNGFYFKLLDKDNSFTIKVRPRPFFHLQDEDVTEINRVFSKKIIEIMEGKATNLRYDNR